jgi:hypothetical protein
MIGERAASFILGREPAAQRRVAMPKPLSPEPEPLSPGSTFLQPFLINIDDAVLERIRHRLLEARWAAVPVDDTDWKYGTDAQWLHGLVDYWTSTYDWRAAERELNRWPQFRASVKGQDIHFYHVKGSAKRPRPLLLTHGWPGSVLEFLACIERLAFPERHGGYKISGRKIFITYGEHDLADNIVHLVLGRDRWSGIEADAIEDASAAPACLWPLLRFQGLCRADAPLRPRRAAGRTLNDCAQPAVAAAVDDSALLRSAPSPTIRLTHIGTRTSAAGSARAAK